MIKSFSSRYLVYFYSHSHLWGANQENERGKVVDAEDKMAMFASTLLDIAADNIPKTSAFPKRKSKHWFNEDCQAAKKERNKANRLAYKHPSAASSMRARLIQARTKKLFQQKKRDSWKIMYPQSMLIPI